LDDVAVLQSIFDGLPVGVAVCDHDGKLLCFNPEAERILGVEMKEIGPPEWTSTYGLYLPDMVTSYPPQRLPLARCLAGEEVPGELLFVRNPRQPGGVWISVSARPFRDREGAILGGVCVFRDITAAQNLLRTEGGGEATRMAPPAGVAAGTLLDQLDGLRGYLARLMMAVEQTADSVLITDSRGVIEYVNPAFQETTGYSAQETLGRTPAILKSGLHDERFYAALWSRLLAGESYRGTITNRKKCGDLYLAEQTISPIKDSDGRISHFVSVLKDVTELRKQQEQEFYLALAHTVQQRFYNTRIEVPGFDIAGAAYPATSTGGDYFDFIRQPDGGVVLAIGDVSGHGFGAALVMAETRAYLRSYASLGADLGTLLSRVNSALARDLDGSLYVTLLLVRLDPRTRSFRYAGAGHVPGYLLRRTGGLGHVLESSGPPLGLFPERQYTCGPEVAVGTGETLILPTDGVAESFSPAGLEFGIEPALDYCRRHPDARAHELIEGIHGAAREFAGGQDQQDDISLIVAKAGHAGRSAVPAAT
jgi:PAS domain S-box-containing protein